MSFGRHACRLLAPRIAWTLALGVAFSLVSPVQDVAHAQSSPRITRSASQRAAKVSRTARRSQRRRARRRLRRYRRMAQRWHRRASRALRRAYEQADPPPLILRPIWMERMFRLQPESDAGGFSEEAVQKASRALASKDDGDAVPVHPRLVELVYDAMRHFDSPFVWVISGYREESGDSRHTRGRAVDIVLPGVKDRELARYLSWRGFVGVGYCPNSGFVHVDVREHSYFWIDRSLPGRRSRHRSILRGRAAKADRRARRRGVEP